jgi:hypothetical protein
MARKAPPKEPATAPVPTPERPANTMSQAWSGTQEQQDPAGKDPGDVEEVEADEE